MPNTDKETTQAHVAKSKRQETRKRSPMACLSCRTRKVRCDVAFVTNACTNCVLDEKECVVERRRRRRRHRHHSAILSSHSTTSERVVDSQVGIDTGDEDDSAIASTEDDDASPKLPSTESGELLSHVRLQRKKDVKFSHYRFIYVSHLDDMLPDDINYLESQGCLAVPDITCLGELLRVYFLHAHTLLPVLNEAECWAAYDAASSRSGIATFRISLLLLSAMLFVSCHYIEDHVAQSMGFTTACEAQQKLYRRTKLLYDQETESSPLILAQVCLLLAHWSSQSPSSSGQRTAWLHRAILHFQSISPPRTQSDSLFAWPQLSLEEQANLARVWNCCVLSDCVHSLYNRSPLIIASSREGKEDREASMNVRGYLSYELGRSQVYKIEQKQRWIEAQVQGASLCGILTRVLRFTYPQDDNDPAGRKMTPGEQEQCIHDFARDLRAWHAQTLSSLPSSRRRHSLETCESENTTSCAHNDPHELLLRTLYIHYNSAMLALHHREIQQYFRATSLSKSPRGQPLRILQAQIYRCVTELSDQALKSLQQKQLPQLPNSIIYCMLMPLFLHSLDTAAGLSKGSALSQEDDLSNDCAASWANDLNRPEWIRKVVESLRHGFYDDLCGMVRTIEGATRYLSQVLHTRQDGTAFILKDGSPSDSLLDNEALHVEGIKWADLLMKRPRAYAQLIGTLDDAIICGRSPVEPYTKPRSLSESYDLLMYGSSFQDSLSEEDLQSLGMFGSVSSHPEDSMQQMLSLGTPEDDFFLQFDGSIFNEGSPGTTSFIRPDDLHTRTRNSGKEHHQYDHRTTSIREAAPLMNTKLNAIDTQTAEDLVGSGGTAKTDVSAAEMGTVDPLPVSSSQEMNLGLKKTGERDWSGELAIDDISSEYKAMKASLMTDAALVDFDACMTV